MKKLLSLIVALLSVFISVAQKPIIIKGKIDNCQDNNTSFIERHWFNPETLQEENIRTDFAISDNGSFQVEIPSATNYYFRYWIHLGHEFTHLDLIEGDHLNMSLDAKAFDESIKYKGSGAERNNYRRDVFLQIWEKKELLYFTRQQNFNQLVDGLTDYAATKIDLLNQHLNGGKIDSSYYDFEKTIISFEVANKIFDHFHNFRNHNDLPSRLASKIDAFLQPIQFNNDRFLQSNEFRFLLVNLPQYMVYRETGASGQRLDLEIKFANAHYTPLMQLYFKNELMVRQLRGAKTRTEKAALLKFFDQQFTEPFLKKEIRRQSNLLRNERITNSHLIQGTLLVTFWCVLLVAFSYLVVALISFLGKKRVKINLALGVKYIILSAIFIGSLAYVGHDSNLLKNLFEVSLVAGYFLVHAFFFIPKYLFSGRRADYFKSVFVSLFVFVAGISFLESNYIPVKYLLNFFFGITLASWIFYYIIWLAKDRKPLKSVTTDGRLNIELAVHLVIGFLANSFILANSSSDAWGEILMFYGIIFVFYFHTFFCFPNFFRKDKIIGFAAITLGLLLVIFAGIMVFDASQAQVALRSKGIERTIQELFNFKYFQTDVFLVFVLLLLPSFIYYFVKKQIKNTETAGFKMYRKKEAELAQLRSQVNPHFLFNTLNTLYAFALKEGSEKTAECIAKLANLMRFMLDDMEKESILLQREVSYIQDYVKLQSIRSAVEHDIAITIDIEEEQGYSIAPMLLIPFVENAFKHGMNPNKISQLKIDITGKGNKIQFVIENSIDENFEAYYKEKGFGIGIENVKSRLKYIYPDRHNISIAKTNNKFIVILTVDIL